MGGELYDRPMENEKAQKGQDKRGVLPWGLEMEDRLKS